MGCLKVKYVNAYFHEHTCAIRQFTSTIKFEPNLKELIGNYKIEINLFLDSKRGFFFLSLGTFSCPVYRTESEGELQTQITIKKS